MSPHRNNVTCQTKTDWLSARTYTTDQLLSCIGYDENSLNKYDPKERNLLLTLILSRTYYMSGGRKRYGARDLWKEHKSENDRNKINRDTFIHIF